MSRIKNPTTNREMGRSRVTSPSKDSFTDDGTTLISIVKGEQIQIQITANWMTNLSGATVLAKVVEGDNDGLGTVPEAGAASPQVTTLSIIDDDPTDNIFKIIIPETLIDAWGTQPAPNKPVYGFFGLEIDDGGVGDNKQVWKPLRGLVEVIYSPTEV